MASVNCKTLADLRAGTITAAEKRQLLLASHVIYFNLIRAATVSG